jgi:hypothetical protein
MFSQSVATAVLTMSSKDFSDKIQSYRDLPFKRNVR